MKHAHNADISVSVDTEELEDLVDKITEAAITVIVVATVAQIVKSYLVR